MADFNVLIDSDMALGSKNADVDDAIAILLALSEKRINVLGISPSFGNVPGEKSGPNIDRLLKLIGKNVDHASYAARSWDTSLWVNNHWKNQDPIKNTPCSFGNDMTSAEFIVQKLLCAQEPVYMVTIGPLTNLAVAISLRPEIVPKIKALYMMGGTWNMPGINNKNIEFNILCDPEAAHYVFSFPIPVVMFPLDVTKKKKVYPENLDKWLTSDKPFLKYLAGECISFMKFCACTHGDDYGNPHAFFHDVMPILALLYPEMFELVPCKIDVDTNGEFTRGKTIIDTKLREISAFPHLIAKDVDEEKAFQYVLSHIAQNYGDVVMK